MKVKASAPIHAATDIETATVTAIKMIAATTGLNAFLLFRSLLILNSPFPKFLVFRLHKRMILYRNI